MTPAASARPARASRAASTPTSCSIEPGETGAIKVDQVRDAIERSAYRPFEGRRRVVIIDDADAVLVEAQNALLKTLEEPPSASMFVLVTSRPDVLLPTVRSRCQRLRFGRLAPADVADVLIRRARLRDSGGACRGVRRRRQRRRGAGRRSEDFAEARDGGSRAAAGRRRVDAIRAAGSTAPRC